MTVQPWGGTPPVCPYCNRPAVLRDSAVIYGRSYGMAWICKGYPACDAYVGVHRDSNAPLGRLADRELRQWKKRAHAAFDPLWQSGDMKRKEAYAYLREIMGMTADEAHIGKFDVGQCKALVEALERTDAMAVSDGLPTLGRAHKRLAS